jgi:branched-chain amino acid transport system ATP-binding protein
MASSLKIENLNLSFGGIKALNNISFEVERGEFFSLIGPNGAGKTTVFNCINGIYKPDSGSIKFRSTELIGKKPHRIAQLGIARTFQNIELFAQMTTLDNLLLGRHRHLKTGILSGSFFGPGTMREEMEHRKRVEEIMDLLDLQFARNQFVANLPYGMQKMVELGRALATEPNLLLLDEPFAGMNAEEKQDLVFKIKDIRAEFDVTILLVEHDMRTVMSLSDTVLAINEGSVLSCGNPEEVQRHPEVIRAYLGVE